MLNIGCKGIRVKMLQKKLKELEFYNGPINGVYETDTFEAVVLFQDACGLQIDGVLGRQTQKALLKILTIPVGKRFFVMQGLNQDLGMKGET